MNNILSSINKLNGVHHVCIYRDGEDVLSTFPDDHRDIESMAQMVEQVFSALQAIDKSHDELYFTLEDKLLAVYLMYDSHIAILLTEKKINFPLIHMGIRSASAKIKRHVAMQQPERMQEIEAASALPAVPKPPVEIPASAPTETSKTTDVAAPVVEATPAPIPEPEPAAPVASASADPELDSIMDKLLEELINYFGPAAKFVFEDAVIQWETKYVKNKNNIPELGEILQEELDTPEEKRAFAQFVTKILH